MGLIIAVVAALLLTQAGTAAHYRHYHGHLLNDLKVTPGVVDSAADSTAICATAYTSQLGVRHVTDATKKAAYQEYAAARTTGKSLMPPSKITATDSTCCEIDHLVSLELGGSNDVKNLWPEPYPDATAKDKVENGLHWLVCHRRIGLRVAQRGIAANWVQFRDSLVKQGNWVGVKAENVR